MQHRRSFIVALSLVLLSSAPSFAGIADTPPPELEAGKKTYHTYSVPG